MAITRIKFNDTASPSGAYTLSINPSRVELNDNSEHSVRRSLDGGGIIQRRYFDARSITFSWVGIPMDFGSNFSTMLGTLLAYVGQVKYVNFGTADYRANPTPNWNKIRVQDVAVSTEPGGKIKRNVIMTLIPEP